MARSKQPKSTICVRDYFQALFSNGNLSKAQQESRQHKGQATTPTHIDDSQMVDEAMQRQLPTPVRRRTAARIGIRSTPATAGGTGATMAASPPSMTASPPSMGASPPSVPAAVPGATMGASAATPMGASPGAPASTPPPPPAQGGADDLLGVAELVGVCDEHFGEPADGGVGRAARAAAVAAARGVRARGVRVAAVLLLRLVLAAAAARVLDGLAQQEGQVPVGRVALVLHQRQQVARGEVVVGHRGAAGNGAGGGRVGRNGGGRAGPGWARMAVI